jgi:hypothetical protein
MWISLSIGFVLAGSKGSRQRINGETRSQAQAILEQSGAIDNGIARLDIDYTVPATGVKRGQRT